MPQICNGYLVYLYLKVFIKTWFSLCLSNVHIHKVPILLFEISPGKKLAYCIMMIFMLFQCLQNDVTPVKYYSSLNKKQQLVICLYIVLVYENSGVVCVINERKSPVKWRKFLAELGFKMNMTSWPTLSLDFQTFLALVDIGRVFVPVRWHWRGKLDNTGGKWNTSCFNIKECHLAVDMQLVMLTKAQLWYFYWLCDGVKQFRGEMLTFRICFNDQYNQ